MPQLTMPAGATLSFQARYDLEFQWDGVVQEISTDGGANWTDLPPDGGYPSSFAQTGDPAGNACGYDASQGAFNGVTTASSNADPGNGTSTAMFKPFTTSLEAYAGQSVMIRWRFSSDPAANFLGFLLDSVRIEAPTTDQISPTASTAVRSSTATTSRTAATTCANDGNQPLSFNAPARTFAPVSFWRFRFLSATGKPKPRRSFCGASRAGSCSRSARGSCSASVAVAILRFVHPVTSAFMIERRIAALAHGERGFTLSYRWTPWDQVSQATADRARRGGGPEVSVSPRLRRRSDPGRDRRCRGRRSPARREHDQPAGREESFPLERAQLRAQGARSVFHGADRDDVAEAAHPRGVSQHRRVRRRHLRRGRRERAVFPQDAGAARSRANRRCLPPCCRIRAAIASNPPSGYVAQRAEWIERQAAAARRAFILAEVIFRPRCRESGESISRSIVAFRSSARSRRKRRASGSRPSPV